MFARSGMALSSRMTVNGLRRINNKNITVRAVRQLSTVQQQSISSTTSDDTLHKDIRNAYTHNPIEGYIRISPFENVSSPNLPLDVYVWQNLPKYTNHVAMVCR